MRSLGLPSQGLRRIAQYVTKEESDARFYEIRDKVDSAMHLLTEASLPELLDELTPEGQELLVAARKTLWLLWDDFDFFCADILKDDLHIQERRNVY